MSHDTTTAHGEGGNMVPSLQNLQGTQGVDLSEHTNHNTATRMERAQAQWTKLSANGVRMATRPFDQFRRPVLSKANERENEPCGDQLTEKLPNIT